MVRCKKIVRNSAAAVLTLSLLTGIASAAFGTGTVTASSLRVREDASTSAATLDTLSKGSKVSVLADEQDGFYKVQIGEQVGYMSAEYLDVTEGETLEEAPAADSSAAAEAVEPLYGLVNTSVLNVRSGAGTDYDRVGKLSGGTVVTVLAEAGDGWYQVSTDSLTGYVSGEYLTVVDAKTLEELSTKGLQLVELAMEYLGVPYRYGGASPSGFDCSGFVYWCLKEIGANQGYIYIRAEYPIAVKRLETAIRQAKEYGLLGKNIFDSGFDFDIQLRLGAGAFVCGEETALLISIEGKRGEPRPRPPFPAVKGLFGKPTLLNNVETYANITWILNNGWEKFAAIGTEKSKGTKVFALGGKITNTGLVEIPMGTTLRTIIEDIGGGIPNGKKFKAAQTGGPSGGCIPAEHIDTPIDYDNLAAIGTMMGSGGLIVMDEDTCMVDIAKFFLEFTVDESCGKCTPCRVGTKRLLELLTKITEGRGTMEDLDRIEELAAFIKSNSLCGLGQTAPNPVLSTLRYFREEYREHILEKRCPAGVCKDLLTYSIDPVKCRGCTICAQNCPADAIKGSVKNPHKIDTSKCIKCGSCYEKCRFGAVIRG